ncbi:MAG: hypothetical protein IIT50_07240, partial [Bacteroidales bacterium]|nr:hypothetical protein [Bacteroidales bacterium]
MRHIRIASLLLMMLVPFTVRAQEPEGIVIDYNNPQKYVIAGVTVDGNTTYSDQQVISASGMQTGVTVTVPGEDISAIVNRLWLQRYFEDVAVSIDSLNASRDSAWFKITILERPRMSRWTFTGVKSGEKKDIEERLNFRRGGEFSDYVSKTSSDIIKRFYAEKGFINTVVTPQVTRDTLVRGAVRVNFDVDRGERIRIKTINFIGNDDVKEYKIAKQMKKTKSNKLYNFFHSKKFNSKEYENDKVAAISAFNEAGYRDARLVKDSVYYVDHNRLGIDLVFDQGDKYYFRDITWTGNSVNSTDNLNELLAIKNK